MKGRVYFALCGDKMKIGFSYNVAVRLSQLGSGREHPMLLLGSIGATIQDEKSIHRSLRAFQIKGEWYRDCEELRTAVQRFLDHPSATDKYAPPQFERKFAAVARALWPRKTADNLAALVGGSQRAAMYWLSGERDPPAKVISKIIAEITADFE